MPPLLKKLGRLHGGTSASNLIHQRMAAVLQSRTAVATRISAIVCALVCDGASFCAGAIPT